MNMDETLTLLYYAGYLTQTVCCFREEVISVLIIIKISKKFKIPNWEVMVDWGRWIAGKVEGSAHVLEVYKARFLDRTAILKQYSQTSLGFPGLSSNRNGGEPANDTVLRKF